MNSGIVEKGQTLRDGTILKLIIISVACDFSYRPTSVDKVLLLKNTNYEKEYGLC